MKRILYCSMRDRYMRNKSYGVVNKIETQKKCFENAGCKVFLRSPKGGNIVLPGGRRISNGKWDKISLPKQIDFMYLRFDAADRSFVRLLKKYKKENPKGKVLLEIPTYPFKDQYVKGSGFLFYLQSICAIRCARRYLDRIVLVSAPEKSVFGKRTLHINNGVDYDNVKVRTVNCSDGAIHIACVSTFAKWHGYDRLIEGLKIYNEEAHDKKVVLHMVGDGEERSYLQEVTKKYGIEESVVFHGVLKGEELNHIYDLCDVAADCFGCHRVNIQSVSSLKSKEYGAKGIPIVTSVRLDIYNNETKKYICEFPQNDDPIEINRVVEFYNDVYEKKTKQQACDEIRDVFKKACSIETNFKNVIDYITKGE
ncbi:MAG: glycosyltransferase [Lachnospiraceae bacterium]|nr:glycosyltransferase [Lachnospiraceae bacterium]MDE7239158.1 glycosyltransferase [Lachnospiraceae bacterium]